MAKFSVGEVAIFDLSVSIPGREYRADLPPNGAECELVAKAQYSDGRPSWDCVFPGHPNPRVSSGAWRVPETNLRKRRPPESYKDQFTPASKDFNWREPVKGEVVA
jgi:hypothetical protein